jgi:ABC-2 type transport system ATP-binding protein
MLLGMIRPTSGSAHVPQTRVRLAQRIGIIHNGRMLQELDVADLEHNRRRRLILRARDIQAAQRVLDQAGTPPTHLAVEEEDLEQYFLRLVGMDGRPQHE